MKLAPGLLIKNLIPSEPVTITKIELLGSMTSINYIGINSNMSNHKLLYNYQLDSLEIMAEEGKFNFKGELGKFSKIYLNENVPFFEVTSPDYYLVDKSLYIKDDSVPKVPSNGPVYHNPEGEEEKLPESKDDQTTREKVFKSITISGKVDIANYSQVFTSFINPLLKNNVEINITITGRTTGVAPLTEKSDQYKITKESASQLGLNFEVEE